MSGIPSFAIVVEPAEVGAPLLTCWDVENLVDPKIGLGEAWETSFENEWQIPLLERILSATSKNSLRYLTQEIALLPVEAIAATIKDFDELLTYLVESPEVICQHNLGRSFSPAEVASALTAAQPDHLVDEDDYKTMLDAFSAFLASQRAALSHANASRKALVYVQFHG